MNKFFRRLPLLAKLMLIGLVPFIFLVFLTVQVYNDKTEKLNLFDSYKIYMEESANINGLIDALQEERKFSFDYAMTKSMRKELVLQRPRTDALLQKIIKSGDPTIAGLTSYTKLGELSDIRDKIDSFKIKPDVVMHYYSNNIYRLSTLNTIPPANTAFLQPVYNDLMVQKILSEMITMLGLIRSNIYNVLHTRQYMIETLMGTVGTHDVYKSYDAELIAKASPATLEQYKTLQSTTALKPTLTYIDTLFKRFSFDSSYTAIDWWKVSDEGVNALRKFQTKIWNGLNEKLDVIYMKEKKSRNRTLVFLILALVSVILVVSYIVFIISRTLRQLRFAAEKISNGETGICIKQESNDVIGSLAKSISKIDENNRVIAEAAVAIGDGDFTVQVKPRSQKDVLGNAIAEMKNELEAYSQKMELLVEQRTSELARSNEDLQQFTHVASHDLKEPLRKIITFSNILSNEQKELLSEKGKLYLQKIEHSSKRMSNMIDGVLAYSTV
jgi:methyl-accepting chemotaxis protein